MHQALFSSGTTTDTEELSLATAQAHIPCLLAIKVSPPRTFLNTTLHMMDGLAADEVGTRRNVQGGGDDEVTLGGSARGGHSLNLHEDEANCGHGAECNVDPDEERMLRLMRALRVKVAIPVFKGDKNEDPLNLRQRPWITWRPQISLSGNV